MHVAESTEIDAHKSHVRSRISCEYVAFPGWQTILRAPVQSEQDALAENAKRFNGASRHHRSENFLRAGCGGCYRELIAYFPMINSGRETMRAIVVAGKNRAGIGTVETPTPGASEIRVRVKAAALNRADLLVLAGHQHGSVGGAGAILGLECSGEVESLGQDATGFAIGDRAMCSARHAIAEYAVTDAGRATKIPVGMSFEEATTLPVALQTMHDALMTNGRLKKGESVLVQGASSGVGLMALKIAKLMGAGLVIGTSTNEARRARLKEFGADLALDLRSTDWVEVAQKATGGKGVDLIIDQISGYVANANMQAASVLGL